ncbi:MAG TPA: hypothetical protein VLJ39_20685 [Tepidisphaeraceae bacterium]|jgi:hypothetical protein|nr:hypothetical protein [Tepidisphaeraceae bacterium]
MKRFIWIGAAATLVLLLGGGGQEFTSLAAKSAKRKYDSALAAAQLEYDRQAQKARDAYLAELNAALKQALRSEQLDEANRLKAEIEAKSIEGSNRLAGAWNVTWMHGGLTARYTFTRNVVEVTGTVHYTGKVQSVGGSEAIAVFPETGDVHRYTLIHGRLFIEGFSKTLSGQPNSIGLGEPVKSGS